MTSSRKNPPKRTPEIKSDPTLLKGRVALVAGATRGVGRGIAMALGESGATVYCTGRSSRSARSASAARGRGVAERGGKERQKLWPAEYYAERPETIEETAELVTARGGKGIAVVVDHLEPDQVEKLVERIRSEQGKLNILVNDISESAEYEFGQTFWNIDPERGFAMFRNAGVAGRWIRCLRTDVRRATPGLAWDRDDETRFSSVAGSFVAKQWTGRVN